jgi:phospholipid/cholesterol/gamma-HCH transport system substrate-binding protein
MTSYAITQGAGQSWRNVRTGLLFFIGLVLVASLALVIGKNSSLLSSHSSARIFLPDIKGLAEGNLVSISGKKVGTVAAMEFTRQNDTAGVLIMLDIKSDYFDLLTSDSKAKIKSLGMLGDKYVDITLGNSTVPLHAGDYLTVTTDAGFEELTASAIRTVDRIGEVSRSINDLTERINRGEGTLGQLMTSNSLSDRLTTTLVGVRTIVGKISSGNGLIGKLISDGRMAGDVAATLRNAQMVSGELSMVASSLRSGRGSLGRLIADDSLYDHLTSVVRHADSLVVQLNDRSSDALGSFSRSSILYSNLNRSLASLDSLFIDMKRNPGRYVTFKVF